jgi:chromosome segregation ATPase
MKLYEIPAALRALEAQIEEAEGVLTPELEAELEAVQGEFERKAEWIAMLIREAKLEAEKWKAEEERVQNRRRALERRAEHLNRYLHMGMTAMDQDKVKGEMLTVSLQRNSQPTIAYEGSPDGLPDVYKRVRVEMDAQALREAYKAGQELPDGVSVHFGTHLRIR